VCQNPLESQQYEQLAGQNNSFHTLEARIQSLVIFIMKWLQTATLLSLISILIISVDTFLGYILNGIAEHILFKPFFSLDFGITFFFFIFPYFSGCSLLISLKDTCPAIVLVPCSYFFLLYVFHLYVSQCQFLKIYMAQ
jgi:hypothetical protein